MPGTVEAKPDEGFWFGQFRMGLWPNFYKGSAFPQSKEALDQFFRWMTPNTAPYDAKVNAAALAAVLEKSGRGSVLVTHSQGGGIGWLVGMMSGSLGGIVSYEPGSGFVFPEGEVPEPIENSSFFGPFKAVGVPAAEFKKLTRYPIVIYYGDFIPGERTDNPHADYWRAAVKMARLFADAVNRHGGDARVIELPEKGIRGNSHFPFAEVNNIQVADELSAWLKEKKLDRAAE